MIQSLHLRKLRTALLFSTVGFLAVSCGSYQSASYYDNDGIYGSDTRVAVERAPQKPVQKNQQQNDNGYSNYFGQKADEVEEILDSEVFTDVDSYSSGNENDTVNEAQLTDYYDNGNDYIGNAGWGDNPSNVSINIYDNGWNNWGYGGAGFGWGFNNWGYGGYGWNRWNRWNNWGYGGYGWNRWNRWGWSGFGWGGGYGYANAWCLPYGGAYYGNRNYAYNSGRRGYYNNALSSSAQRATLRGRSNLNTTRSISSRYRSSSARSNANRSGVSSRSSRTSNGYRNNGTTSRSSVGVDRNRAYRTSRSTRAVPRDNSSSRSNQTYRSPSPRSSTYRSGTSSSRKYSGTRSSTPRTSTYRSSSSRTRSASPSRSSSRSSGTYRSSRSSSTRSSSGYRSSGGSSSSRSYSGGRSSSSSSRSSGGRSGSSRGRQ